MATEIAPSLIYFKIRSTQGKNKLLKVNEIDYDTLLKSIKSLFTEEQKNFSIKYKDAEGDLLEIENDSDLQTCISEYLSLEGKKQKMKLMLVSNGQENWGSFFEQKSFIGDESMLLDAGSSDRTSINGQKEQLGLDFEAQAQPLGQMNFKKKAPQKPFNGQEEPAFNHVRGAMAERYEVEDKEEEEKIEEKEEVKDVKQEEPKVEEEEDDDETIKCSVCSIKFNGSPIILAVCEDPQILCIQCSDKNYDSSIITISARGIKTKKEIQKQIKSVQILKIRLNISQKVNKIKKLLIEEDILGGDVFDSFVSNLTKNTDNKKQNSEFEHQQPGYEENSSSQYDNVNQEDYDFRNGKEWDCREDNEIFERDGDTGIQNNNNGWFGTPRCPPPHHPPHHPYGYPGFVPGFFRNRVHGGFADRRRRERRMGRGRGRRHRPGFNFFESGQSQQIGGSGTQGRYNGIGNNGYDHHGLP